MKNQAEQHTNFTLFIGGYLMSSRERVFKLAEWLDAHPRVRTVYDVNVWSQSQPDTLEASLCMQGGAQ